MKTVLDFGVLTLAVLAMLLVGLELEFHRFKQLVKYIFPLSVAFVLQIILIPGIGIFLSYTLDLSPTLRSGILLIAACPVGDIANYFTLIGKGNLAISVTYNAISCLISPLTMTIIFAVYNRVLQTPFAFAAPGWRLVLPFFLLITVPILAGSCLHFVKTLNLARISRSLKIVCLIGILALCVFVIVARFNQFKTDWRSAFTASALLAAASMVIGSTVSRVLRMDRADSLSMLISFSIRNVGLATAIAITLMSRIEYAVFSTVYFLSEVVLVFGVVIAIQLWEAKGNKSGALDSLAS